MRATARTFLVAALALGLALPSIGYANTKAGEALVKQGTIGGAPCMQCHGANGEGQAAAGYPRLAGQSKAYLMKQLQDFKSGQRHDPLMNVFAQALKEQQISDVAEYYASLPGWQPSKQAWSTLPTSPAPPTSLGLALVQQGNWDKGIPACFACHGEKGAGIFPFFPLLAGQHKTYLLKQLTAWQSGARANDPQGLMKAVAQKMSPAEMTAVSTYLESLQ